MKKKLDCVKTFTTLYLVHQISTTNPESMNPDFSRNELLYPYICISEKRKQQTRFSMRKKIKIRILIISCRHSMNNILKSREPGGLHNNIKFDTVVCIIVRHLACLWSKMPMFQWAEMKEGVEPLPLAFQYLILMI